MEPAMPLVRQLRWIGSCFALLWFALLVLDPGAGSARAQTRSQTELAAKTVLVLHAHESNVPAFIETDKGISDTLLSGGVSSLNLFFESLDLRRHPSPEHRHLLVEQIRIRHGHRNFDMIITMYPEALQFVLGVGGDILSEVPILALYLPQNFEMPQTARRIVGHTPAMDIAGTLEIARKLVSGVTRVYVVSGAHSVDKGFENKLRAISGRWEGRLEFFYLSHLPLEEMLAAVAGVPPGSIILALPVSQDITGTNYTSPILAQRLSRVAAAPIFGLITPMLGCGIVGGSLINFELIGQRAGEFVLDMLTGTKTQDNIPPTLDVPPVPMFDWRQLRRWNLSEHALPEGSIVINREPTLSDFRFYIIGALAFVLAQSSLIAGFLINKRRRRSTEASLRQKTEELAQFFNVTLDLLCIARTDGYFLLLNPAWERTLGYSREELTAKPFLDFVHPDDLERTLEALSTLASQGELIHFENRYRAKDGSYRWLEWTSAPVGNLIYAAARDFTDRLKAEAEARQRREELAHVTRIAMMGEMTTSLAHEINQPLTAILSNAQAARRFLSQSLPDLGEIKQILDDIIRDDRRASEVVGKIRAFVKKEKPRREPLDLNGICRQLVDLLRADSLLQGLSIATDLSPELPTVHGDGIQLEQVLLNLILNGAAAMRNAPAAQRKIVVQTAMVNDGTVKVAVRDFGVGIDENHMERLFQPFYTTKPEGLGMGLAISQTIIKAHGGTMGAKNNPEGGATFHFTLPTDHEVHPF
jgi:PAS domain S-box-containing protein